ncbi:hypothetical protein B5F40_10230 [Gordonibacter sp. An230]|uniref:DEAD/DEAH box helicase n=1 Tax=Gordonibacter sp. An230 TaxID=1965592 RepID=UPI000B371B4D|nr:AAA domain-containing protein [Gordonibacter sp. An230]OUO89605.1 hypothetical protein B5F40_10230 [Gordonibacter sp. An230]
MGKKRGKTRKRLLAYLEEAARIAGEAGPEAVRGHDCYRDGQAFYSLLWYFRNCICDDLDRDQPDRYSPLLDAYLGADIPDVFHPPALEPESTRAEDELLERLFPQSRYPLNGNQRIAVHKALHFPLSIIKGPPGTGKTETILRIAAMAVARGERVAVVSTNSAAVRHVEKKVDEALERYGRRSPADAKRLFEGDLAYQAACKHVALGSKGNREGAVDPLTGASLAFESGEHAFPNGEVVTGWELNKEFDSFTAKFPFVTSTVHSLKKCFVDGDAKRYDLLIMDEASQTNLVVGVVAMSCARRMVVVGDEEQLPPVISDDYRIAVKGVSDDLKPFKKKRVSPYDMAREGHSFLSSCYEVFGDENPELRTMLTEHYRCHPAIIGFCNEEVYGRELQIETPVQSGSAPCPIRICWYEGDYREGVWPPTAPPEEEPDKKLRATCVNRKQMAILREEEGAQLLSLATKGKSICILSPFRGQIYLLRAFVRQLLKGVVAENEIELETGEGEEREAVGLEQVYTLTIHKSQGQEFDVVYLLPVEDGNWEWPWSQGRRLVNVAASRAKEELRVILSTKLLDGDTQEWLAGRQAYAKRPAKSEDDPENQEMFVRKLVEYTRRTIDGLSEGDAERQRAHPSFGFHRSVISSVFDDIPFEQNPKREGGDYAPERCIEKALRAMRLPGLAVVKQVTFDQVLLEGGRIRLSDCCKSEYDCPSEAHFDFVIVEVATGRVVMALEVDGCNHRFKRKKGRIDYSQMLADDAKNVVARDVCHATLAWLGPVRDGSLPCGAQGLRTAQGDWTCFPSRMKASSSFVFLRVPSDGSTFWETDALRREARRIGADKRIASSYEPPTIEEYVRAQQGIFEGGEAAEVRVAEDVWRAVGSASGRFAPSVSARDCGSVSGNRPMKITECLAEWRKDARLASLLKGVSAADLNARLVRAGYQVLEGGDLRRRVPSEQGRSIGMTSYHGRSADGPYVCPEYSREAREHLAERMEDILRA